MSRRTMAEQAGYRTPPDYLWAERFVWEEVGRRVPRSHWLNEAGERRHNYDMLIGGTAYDVKGVPSRPRPTFVNAGDDRPTARVVVVESDYDLRESYEQWRPSARILGSLDSVHVWKSGVPPNLRDGIRCWWADTLSIDPFWEQETRDATRAVGRDRPTSVRPGARDRERPSDGQSDDPPGGSVGADAGGGDDWSDLP